MSRLVLRFDYRGCPCCNGTVMLFLSEYDSSTGDPIYKIMCEDCQINITGYDENELIERWNKRVGEKQ